MQPKIFYKFLENWHLALLTRLPNKECEIDSIVSFPLKSSRGHTEPKGVI